MRSRKIMYGAILKHLFYQFNKSSRHRKYLCLTRPPIRRAVYNYYSNNNNMVTGHRGNNICKPLHNLQRYVAERSASQIIYSSHKRYNGKQKFLYVK